MQTDTMREKTFNMRLAPEEWVTFEAVAAHYGLPVSSMLRMLVKEKSDAIGGRPTRRSVLAIAFDELAAGREITSDVIAIKLRIPLQKARNIGLLMCQEGVLKETTKGGPVVNSHRTFALMHKTFEKALAALKANGSDADEEF